MEESVKQIRLGEPENDVSQMKIVDKENYYLILGRKDGLKIDNRVKFRFIDETAYKSLLSVFNSAGHSKISLFRSPSVHFETQDIVV